MENEEEKKELEEEVKEKPKKVRTFGDPIVMVSDW